MNSILWFSVAIGRPLKCHPSAEYEIEKLNGMRGEQIKKERKRRQRIRYDSERERKIKRERQTDRNIT